MDTKIEEKYNSYKQILNITINICLSSFTFGFFNGYFNSISFKNIYEIYRMEGYQPSTMQGLLTGILSLTGGIGAYMSKYLLTFFTRKQCFQILSTSTILICLLLLIPNLSILFISRCIQGLIIGMIASITPLYLREFIPVQLYSSLSPFNQIGIVGGLTFSFILTFLLSLVLPVYVYWRIVFGFPLIGAVIQLYNLKYNFPYETPKYLLLQNDLQGTISLLNIIYKKQYVKDVLKELQLVVEFSRVRRSQHSDLGLIQQDIPAFYSQRLSYQRMSRLSYTRMSRLSHTRKSMLNYELLEKTKQRKTRLLSGAVKQLVTNPLAKVAAIHLSISQQMVGMNTIIAYSGQIVGQMFPQIQKIFPIIINCVALAGAFLTIPALTLFGRKTNLNIGALSLGVMLILISISFSHYSFEHSDHNSWFTNLSIYILLLGIRLVFCFSLGPVTWIYIAEVVQPNFIPVSTMVNYFTVWLVVTVFPIVRHLLNGNPALIFLFFGGYTILGFFVNRVVLIETQDKTQYEIQKQYEAKYNALKNK